MHLDLLHVRILNVGIALATILRAGLSWHRIIGISAASRFSLVAATVLLLAGCFLRVEAAATWDGGGADDNWTTVANWVGDIAPSAGAELIFAGSTRLTANNDFPADTSFSAITFSNGAAGFTLSGNRLTLTGPVTNSGTTAQTIGNDMILAATRTVDAASGDLAFTGVLSGAGGLTKQGAGVLTLSGTTSSYSGVTTISAGTLAVASLANGGANSSLGAASNAATNLVINGGTLQYTGGAVTTDRLFSVGTGGATIDASGSGAIGFTNTGAIGYNGASGTRMLTLTGTNVGANSLAAAIGDNGGATSLSKTSTGYWTLSGASAYSGGTSFTHGVLILDASGGVVTGPIGTGTVTMNPGANNARLVLTGGRTVSNALVMTTANTAATSGSLFYTGAGLATWSGPITINANAATGGHFYGGTSAANALVLSGTITTGGTLTKLSQRFGHVWYSGSGNSWPDLSITGRAIMGASSVLPATSRVYMAFISGSGAGGYLDLNGYDQTIAGLTLNFSGGGIVATGAATLTLNATVFQNWGLTLDANTNIISGNLNLGGAVRTFQISNSAAASDLSISAVISNGGIAKTGPGTMTLSGANTYAGTTTVSVGTLLQAAANVIPDASAMSVASIATWNLAGFSETVGSIAGAGSISLGAGTLTCGGDGTTKTFSGVISGAGALTKTGAGVLTLSNTNTYAGATTVSTGSLLVTGSTHASSAVSVSAGATLGGTGTINGTCATADTTTIAPGTGGTTIGTLTLANTSPLSATAITTLAMDLNAGSGDAVVCSAGSGTLALGNIALVISSSSPTAGSYTLVSYPSGTISGTFASVSGVPGNYTLTYGAQAVTLNCSDRYWVGSGNWSNAANWAASTGGPGGATVPTSSNNVYFNGSGVGDCTVDAASQALTLTMLNGYTGVFAFGTNTVTVTGAADLRSGGSFTGTTGGLVMNANGTLTPKSSGTIPNLTVSTGTTTLATHALAVAGNLTIGNGTTLASGNQNISVAGNWANNGGVFTAGSATVTLNGAGGSTQTLSGSTTFHNLTATCTTARTVRFAAGSTQTVNGTLTLDGASGQLLGLRSTSEGSTWSVDPANHPSCTFLDVRDGINVQATLILPASSVDSGNNTRWFTPLSITSRSTADLDGNGRIDAIDIVTSANLNDSFGGLTATVAGYAVSGYSTGASANDATLRVLLTEGGSADTSVTPTVQVTANSSLGVLAIGTLLPVDAGTAASDGAAPVLLSATWSDAGDAGVGAADIVTLAFSESVTTASMVVGDLGLPVSGDGLSSTTIANQSGPTISMTLAGSPVLTPGGSYNPAATTPGNPSGVHLASGVRVVDAASLGGVVGNAAGAVDLAPTMATVGIAWSSGSNPKAWDVGLVFLGATASSVGNLDLTITNTGNCSLRLTAVTTDSAPTGWSPGPAAGADTYLMKADVTGASTATPNDPTAYGVTLGAVAQILASSIYSGSSSTLALYFKAPLTISAGVGVEQSLAVQITAALPP